MNLIEKLQKEGLPEPIARGEKAKLMRASRRVAKGKAFKEVRISFLPGAHTQLPLLLSQQNKALVDLGCDRASLEANESKK